MTEKQKETRIIKQLANPTPAEKALYWELAVNRVRFIKQLYIKGYIIDAYLPKYKIAMECDGIHHENRDKQVDHDLNRDRFLRSLGIRIVRIPNTRILNNPAQYIKQLLKQLNVKSIRDSGVDVPIAA